MACTTSHRHGDLEYMKLRQLNSLWHSIGKQHVGEKSIVNRNKASAAGDAPAAKKRAVVSSTEIDGVCVWFEWEADGNKWTGYSPEDNSLLIEAFNLSTGTDQPQAVLEVSPTVSMLIKFDNMVQKNQKTGRERRLRCSVQGKDGDFYVWQWEDECSNWNPYDVTNTLLLQKRSEVSISACGQSYTVNLDKMEQVNDGTAVIRKVDRLKSDAKRAKISNGAKKSTGKKGRSVRNTTTVKQDDDEDEQSTKSAPESRGKSGSKKSKREEDREGNGIGKEEAGPKDAKRAKISNGSASASNDAKKSTGRKGRSGGNTTTVKEEPDNEDEQPAKSVPESRGKSGSKKSKREEEREEKDTVKTVVMSGKAPMDGECSLAGRAQVYCEGDDIWDCMLNQTNIANNHNKYYLIQLLQESSNKSFHVWQRWGRVGYGGQKSLVPCGSNLDKAKSVFRKKFQDKTKNHWDERDCFKKIAGKYDLIKMDYSAKGSDETDTDSLKENSTQPDCTLDERLQNLIQLICDVKAMEEAVIEMKYDAKKAPLGKLTKDQIKAGYLALKKIDSCIEMGDYQKLERACCEFYTRIPHDFGMKTPPVIRTKEVVKDKIQLLEALDDIEVAIRTLKSGDMSENPVDRHYKSLHCKLDPMDKTNDDYKLIEQYIENTHAKTHNQYKLKVVEVFDCKKENDDINFKDYGNRMLLWHGSRLTNWVGILSQGLRIAPPEAPVTGYMFGKGVYFADMSSKSANYCFASPAKNIGLLLLCEVSLGKCNELLSSDYNAQKLPAGTHSVMGKGCVGPDPRALKTMSDGVLVPVGKGVDTGVKNPSGYTLNYNEYIVYDTKQIKMRYLVKTQFDFR